MKVEYINPFLSSMMSVFGTMTSCVLTRGVPALKCGTQPTHEVSAIIGLSGRAKGTVVLSAEREVALRMTEALLGERMDQINADVTDALGEMANMVAGQSKAQLEHLALSVTLPTVITSKGHSVEFPKNAAPICIPFTCEWGSLALEVALVEQPDGEANGYRHVQP